MPESPGESMLTSGSFPKVSKAAPLSLMGLQPISQYPGPLHHSTGKLDWRGRLDRRLVAASISDLVLAGFGKQVREAIDRRLEHHIGRTDGLEL